jgi:hypothetical protein
MRATEVTALCHCAYASNSKEAWDVVQKLQSGGHHAVGVAGDSPCVFGLRLTSSSSSSSITAALH